MPDSRSRLPDEALAHLGGAGSLAFPDRTLSDVYLLQREAEQQGGANIELSISPESARYLRGESPAPAGPAPGVGSPSPGAINPVPGAGSPAPSADNPSPSAGSPAPAAGSPGLRPNAVSTSETVREHALDTQQVQQKSALYKAADAALRTVTGYGLEDIHRGIVDGTLPQQVGLKLFDPFGNITHDLTQEFNRRLGTAPELAGSLAASAGLLASVLFPPGGAGKVAKAGIETARAAEQAVPAGERLVARYRGLQQGFGDVKAFHLFDTPIDLADETGRVLHTAGSTVNAETIQRLRPDIQLGVRVGAREAAAVAETTAKNGGATFNVSEGRFIGQGEPGFAVSIAPERGKVFDHAPTPDEIQQFAHDNADILSDPRASIGTWVSGGKTHVDVSIVTKSKEDALGLGRQYHQQAVYDLANGSDVAVPKADPGHPYTQSAEPLSPDDVKVAQAYDQALTDPASKPAWDALAVETDRLYDEVIQKIKVEKVTGQPYATAEDLFSDLKQGVMKVTTDNSEHPFWTPEQNFKFRVVHDYIGHFLNGNDFSLEGEYKAWLTHAEKLTNDAAKEALQVEVYGQAAAAVANNSFQEQKAFLPSAAGVPGAPPALSERLGAGQSASTAPTLLDKVRSILGNEFGAVATKIPYTRNALKLAEKGKSSAAWYVGVPEELQAGFGKDWQMVADLIAAASPGQRVEKNLDLAFQAYRDFKNGDDIETILDNMDVGGPTTQIVKRLVGTVLSGKTINEATTDSALKVRNFAAALKGDRNAVVVDRWMSRVFYPEEAAAAKESFDAGTRRSPDYKVKPNRYKLIEAYIKTTSAKLGIDPADFQAAMWAGAKIEAGDANGIEPLRDLIRSKLETGDLADVYASMKPFNLDEAGRARLGTVLALTRTVVGAAAGGTTGESVDDRLRNAMIGAGLGAAASPALIRKLADVLKDESGAAAFFRRKAPMKDIAVTAEDAARFAAVDPNVVQMGDKALSIDWKALGDPQAIDDTVKKLASYVGPEQLEAAKRGVVGDDRLAKMADALGVSFEDVLRLPKGTAANAEEMLATVNLLGASIRRLNDTNDILQAARFHPDGEQEARAAQLFEHQLAVTAAVFEKFYGLRGEAGRALRVLQGEAQNIIPLGEHVSTLVNAMRSGLYPPERISELLASLKEPEQQASFLSQLMRAQGKLLSDMYINALLSTFQGNMANILSNAVAVGSGVAERAIAAGLGTLRGAEMQDKVLAVEAPAMVIGMLHSWRDALGAAAETFKTGQSIFRTSKEVPDLNIQGLAGLMKQMGAWGQAVDFLSKIALGGEDLAGAAQKVERVIGLPGRTLQAADEFFKVMNRNAFVWAEAYREAAIQADQGVIRAERGDFIHQFVATPPERVESLARDFANIQTFNDNLEGRLRSMQSGLSHPLVRFFIPFFKTPVNIFRYNLERFPLLGAAVKREREALQAGGAARDLALAKQAMGAMTLSFASYLVYTGKITGRGPSNPDMNREWRLTHEPYSIKVGDKWVGYNRIDTYGGMLGVAADLAQVSGELQVDEVSEAAVALTVAFSNNMLSKTYVQGLHDILETVAISKPEDFKTNLFNKTVASFIPSGVRQVSKYGVPGVFEGDPTVRETYSFIDELVSRTPGSDLLYPRVGLDGKDVVLPPMLGPDFVSPIPYSDVKKDPVSEELLKQQIRVGLPSKAVFGPRPARLGPTKLEDGIPLNAEQVYRFSKLAGNDLKLPGSVLVSALPDLQEIVAPDARLGMWDALTALVQSRVYQESAHGAKKRLIENIVTHYRDVAERVLIYGLPDAVQASGVTAPPDLAKGDPELLQAIMEKRLNQAEDLAGAGVRRKLEPTVNKLIEGLKR